MFDNSIWLFTNLWIEICEYNQFSHSLFYINNILINEWKLKIII